MNCRIVEPILSAYIDQELSGSQSLEVREHLRICNTCRLESERLRVVRSQLARLETIEPPPDLESRLNSAVFQRRSQRTQKVAFGALLATTSMVATLLAVKFADHQQRPQVLTAHESTHALDAAADRAYLTGNDPISGGVPVITASYAGDH